MKGHITKLKLVGALVLVLFIVCAFGCSCWSNFVSRGEEVEFSGEAEIYMASSGDLYFPLNDEIVEILLEDAEWFAENGGISFIEKTATIEADEVSWYPDGVTEYSCEGAVIKARGVVRIEDDCPEGANCINLILPNLKVLGEMTGTVAMVIGAPPEPAVMNSVVPIQTILVFATEKEAGNAKWIATGIAVALAIVGLIIYGFLSNSSESS